ncbi:MAG: response regulator [Sphaerochaetaceae bacterium]|nr:response regulator [Sphaerochaetaceae bacterium]
MQMTCLLVGVPNTISSIFDQMFVDWCILTAIDTDQVKSLLKEAHEIDLVFIDLLSDSKQRLELLAMMKNDVLYSKVKILVLTDDKLPEIEISAIRMGADDYVRTPVYKESFVPRLK